MAQSARRTILISLATLVFLMASFAFANPAAAAAGAAGDSVQSFSGSAPGGTEPFKVQGPWLLSWNASSEFPNMAYLDLQLYDADTDRFVGEAVKNYGTGSGEKLIRQGGHYRIVANGGWVNWSVKIQPAPENLSSFVAQHPDIREIQLTEPHTGLASSVVKHLQGWSSEGNQALLLKSETGATTRITFYGDGTCPGLEDARNIFFVTSRYNTDLYNAILLENGTRCYLGSVNAGR